MFLAIVPAHNEEKSIRSVIAGLLPVVDEVVVVDDMSSDNTAHLAREAGATVISHSLNRGQGAALETGHAYAREKNASYVLHFDADGQFSIEDIAPALQTLQKKELDIVLGTRFLDTRTNMPWQKRLIIHPVARFFHTSMLGIKVTDVHNGFRILGKRALEAIQLEQDRMAHASEILSLIKKHKLAYAEVPVKVTYHEYGQRAFAGLDIVKDLLIGPFLR